MNPRARNADGEAQSEQSLGEAEGVEVAVALEERTRDCSPDQRSGCEREIRQVGRGEQQSGQAQSGPFAGQKPRETRHEVVVQQELLIGRPQNVTEHVLEVAFIQGVKRTELLGDEHPGDGQETGGGQNPK